jgi:transcriptional regulator with XRE-family HTH domain
MTGAEHKRRREAVNLTQPQLAARWGVSRNTINRWENELAGCSPPAWTEDAFRGIEAERQEKALRKRKNV